MKEIYTSNQIWRLFEESFLVDMAVVANATLDRKHADTQLEDYVVNTVMKIIATFFNSPFSEQSTGTQQVKDSALKRFEHKLSVPSLINTMENKNLGPWMSRQSIFDTSETSI
jgi:hypothetical protein